MRQLVFLIPPEYDGRKLVHFLRGAAGCSATLVKALKLTEDGILLDGVRARTIDRLRAGARLTLHLREQEGEKRPSYAHCAREAAVLYEDDDLMVLDKPADMPCHPAKRHQQDTLGNVFARMMAGRGLCLPWRVINRLDRNTTGAVIAAKNAFAAAALSGRVEKVYLAVAGGRPALSSGAVEAPIGRPDEREIRRAVLPDGQHARTDYRVLCTKAIDPEALSLYSVVRCTLPTGRTHQIRVHMAHIGCPLLGDDLYGGDCREINRQALHCAKVAFSHPVTGAHTEVVAPIPQDMQKFVKNTGKIQQNVLNCEDYE